MGELFTTSHLASSTQVLLIAFMRKLSGFLFCSDIETLEFAHFREQSIKLADLLPDPNSTAYCHAEEQFCKRRRKWLEKLSHSANMSPEPIIYCHENLIKFRIERRGGRLGRRTLAKLANLVRTGKSATGKLWLRK